MLINSPVFLPRTYHHSQPQFSGKKPELNVDVKKANEETSTQQIEKDLNDFYTQLSPYLGWSPKFYKKLQADSQDPSNPNAETLKTFLKKHNLSTTSASPSASEITDKRTNSF